ncbi:hypothetical protein D3C80_1580310 [compost metagenome]
MKIFEKVSPFLKFRRLSSLVREEALPLTPCELKLEMKSGSGLRTAQLAPTDSAESKLPSISPMLKSLANTGELTAIATATATRCG